MSDCELHDPIWAVISHGRDRGSGISYKQAEELLAHLQNSEPKNSGLTIVTAAVAGRLEASRVLKNICDDAAAQLPDLFA